MIPFYDRSLTGRKSPFAFHSGWPIDIKEPLSRPLTDRKKKKKNDRRVIDSNYLFLHSLADRSFLTIPFREHWPTIIQQTLRTIASSLFSFVGRLLKTIPFRDRRPIIIQQSLRTIVSCERFYLPLFGIGGRDWHPTIPSYDLYYRATRRPGL